MTIQQLLYTKQELLETKTGVARDFKQLQDAKDNIAAARDYKAVDKDCPANAWVYESIQQLL